MVEPVSGGVLAGLLTAGLTRFGSAPFQKLLRRANIGKVLKKGIMSDATIQTAIHDFEAVIGSQFGDYDVPLDLFLRELEYTGLIGAIAECAMLKRNSEQTRVAFVRLYQVIIPQSKHDPYDLYDKLYNSFVVTFDFLTQDRALADLVKVSSKQIISRLNNIETALLSYTAEAKPLAPTFDEISENSLDCQKALDPYSKIYELKQIKVIASLI